MQQTEEGEKQVISEDRELSRKGERRHSELGVRGSALNNTPLDSDSKSHSFDGCVCKKNHSQCSRPPRHVSKLLTSAAIYEAPIHPGTHAHIQYIKAHYENERENEEERDGVCKNERFYRTKSFTFHSFVWFYVQVLQHKAAL